MCRVEFYTCPTCEGAGKLLVRSTPCGSVGGIVRCPVCINAGLVCVVDEFCEPVRGRPPSPKYVCNSGKEELS